MGLHLNRGDEVPLNEKQAEHLPQELVRIQDGVTLIDRTVTLGRRKVIAGVEHALIGMKVGGYARSPSVRIWPIGTKAFRILFRLMLCWLQRPGCGR
jgi:hypothetical protein